MAIPANYRPLAGSERSPAPSAQLVGPADPNETLSVTIRVRRQAGAPPLPGHDHWAATPPVRRKFIPRQDFARMHGAAAADLASVAAFAQSKGLTVTETNAARRTVIVSGTVKQMSDAFAVELGRYQSPTESYRGRVGPVHMPAGVADLVEGVFGLDNRRMARRSSNGGPLTITALTPVDVAGLYNFPPIPANIASQTIGILEFGGGYAVDASGNATDLDAFFQGLNPPLATPPLVPVLVNGATNTVIGVDSMGNASGADAEVALDIDVAGAVANGATIAVYFAPFSEQGWIDAVTTAIHPDLSKGQPTPSVLSISWFAGEQDWTAAALSAMSATFQEAAALGVTVLSASGDNGSSGGYTDGNAHVDYPYCDPWITACGGTTIGNVSPPAFTEVTWNDDGVTGGGISRFFPLPSWQVGKGIPPSINDGTTIGRGIPDVAGYADGYAINLYGAPAGTWWGTSETAPLYAGLIAIINATLGYNVGYLNPTFYALGATNLFRDIADGGSNAYTQAVPGSMPPVLVTSPGYTSVAGWDACTGWGSIDGTVLLTQLQQGTNKDCFFILDQGVFGKAAIDWMLTQPSGANFPNAFYVVVDGFTPSELGINTDGSNLANPPALIQFAFAPSAPGGMTIAPNPAGAAPQDIGLLAGDTPQRFTYGFDIGFTNDGDFPLPPQEVNSLAVTATLTSMTTNVTVSSQAQLQLIGQPDPFFNNGATTWLSDDLRVFQLSPGSSLANLPGVVLNDTGNPAQDATSFIQGVIAAFNTSGVPAPPNHPFDQISTDYLTSWLQLLPDVGGTPVYNFAVARVTYQAATVDAQSVRVFFRLFPALSVSVAYDPAATYRRWSDGIEYGQAIPLLGVDPSNNVSVIPCFAEPRIDASSVSLATQFDVTNAQTIVHDPAGGPVYVYYGCWLDINQSAAAYPPTVAPQNLDGPFDAASLQTVQQLMRNQHQCLVAEIAFDPDPIQPDTSPANSGPLAQRNLSWSASGNPGQTASRRIANTFEMRATPAKRAQAEPPDELMIDWGNVPAGSAATIYWPAIDAAALQRLATSLYGANRIAVVDPHTVRVPAGGITYIPIPRGTGNFAGLISVDLPLGVRRGQLFTVVVRQVTNVLFARGIEAQYWRRVLGTFQINIPVETKEVILPTEQRLLSVLRWIEQTIPAASSWRPVFYRYVGLIAGRVDGFGGDAAAIVASPAGEWKDKKAAACAWLARAGVALLAALVIVLGTHGPSSAAVGAILAVGLIAVGAWWIVYCHPTACRLLRSFIAGVGIGGGVLAVLALLGFSTPQLVTVLAGSVVLAAIATAVAKIRGCF